MSGRNADRPQMAENGTAALEEKPRKLPLQTQPQLQLRSAEFAAFLLRSAAPVWSGRGPVRITGALHAVAMSLSESAEILIGKNARAAPEWSA
jgi:hypothetical protein